MDPGTTQVSQEGLRAGASGEPLGWGQHSLPRSAWWWRSAGVPKGLINQVRLLLDSWEGVERERGWIVEPTHGGSSARREGFLHAAWSFHSVANAICPEILPTAPLPTQPGR